MLGGLVREALGGALLRARLEAKRAALAGVAGLLLLGALALLAAAGIYAFSLRYGVIAGLLGGAGLLGVLSLLTFLVARRRRGAAASRLRVDAEALQESVPTARVPHPGAALAEGLGAKPGLGGVLPPGAEAVALGLAARSLTRKPMTTLATAAAIGAAVGLVRFRRTRRVPADRA